MILVGVVWSGNELVGKRGIEDHQRARSMPVQVGELQHPDHKAGTA